MKLKYKDQDDVTKFISSKNALYHFTSKETAIEQILYNQNLRFGDFNLTNDPQEYKSKLTDAIGYGWDDEHHDKISIITKYIDELIKSSGFISMCQNRYEKAELVEEGCLKSRMWSQYGGNHSGICLVFCKEILLQEIQHAIDSEHKLLAKKIEYKDPSSTRTNSSLSVNGYELNSISPSITAENYIFDSQDIVFFQKQPDYKDENEFRIVAVGKRDNVASGTMIKISNSLKAIILGDAFPKVYLPSIKALSAKMSIPYRKLHWENSEYFLLKWDR
jgi:hypothetical protein